MENLKRSKIGNVKRNKFHIHNAHQEYILKITIYAFARNLKAIELFIFFISANIVFFSFSKLILRI